MPAARCFSSLVLLLLTACGPTAAAYPRATDGPVTPVPTQPHPEALTPLPYPEPRQAGTPGPVVGAPCGQDTIQWDVEEQRWVTVPGWYYVELDATGAYVRSYCATVTPRPTVVPVTPTAEPPPLPVRGFMPLVLRRGG